MSLTLTEQFARFVAGASQADIPQAARDKAREWFDRWPKQAYWTEIESWFERPGDVIEFTIRRLPAAD